MALIANGEPQIIATGLNRRTAAQLPAAGSAGRLYSLSDTARGIRMDTGAQWVAIQGGIANAREFGARGDGVTNDQAAIQAALDSLDASGGTVLLPAGNYLVNTELVVADAQYLVGEGRQATVLLAGANNMNVIHHTGSQGGARHLEINGNGQTGVSGLRITPLDETQVITVVNQNFNYFDDLWIISCAEGIVMRCGPDVAGVDSGCWYNRFYGVHIQDCTRSLWLREGTNAGSSPPNRNSWHGCRMGQGSANTGVQIDSGGTNGFFAVDFEGIAVGVAPNATPTAIKIANNDAWGWANESNRFFGCNFEACTRDVENANAYTEFYGTSLNTTPPKVLFTALPLCILGGYNAAGPPQRGPWGLYQQAGQVAGYINGLTMPGGAREDLVGRLISSIAFEETHGSTLVALGATFDVDIPSPRRPQLFAAYSTYNMTTACLHMLHGDGGINIVVQNILVAAAIGVAALDANTIRITNNFGAQATIYWTLVPLGEAV